MPVVLASDGVDARLVSKIEPCGPVSSKQSVTSIAAPPDLPPAFSLVSISLQCCQAGALLSNMQVGEAAAARGVKKKKTPPLTQCVGVIAVNHSALVSFDPLVCKHKNVHSMLIGDA